MSSTELILDKREIIFILREWLRVDLLCRHKLYEDFDGETVELLVEEGLRFAAEIVAPTRTESDRAGCTLENERVKVPECMKNPYRKAYELGWASLTGSRKFEGQGAPACIGLAVSEGITAGNAALSSFFSLTSGAAKLIASFGSSELKEKYVSRMNRGEFTGTMCLSEPHAGSDVGASLTSAEPLGKGVYRIKGTKCWISSGDSDLGKTTVHTVLARIKGAPSGTRGLSLFVVPHTRVESDGTLGEWNDVTVASIENKMGLHASPTAMLKFGENGNCLGWLLGEENRGMSCMFQMMNNARIAVGSTAMALAGAAYQFALKYAGERLQGPHITRMHEGDAPRVAIIEHPAVRHNLMLMKAKVEGMRALLHATAHMVDLTRVHEGQDEDESQMLVDILTPMCKGWCSETGISVIRTGIQVLGGVGYTRDFPLEQLYRDARVSAIYEGTTDIQALDLVGRKMTINDGALFKKLMQRYSRIVEACNEHTGLTAAAKTWENQCESVYELAKESGEVMKTRGIEAVALYATPFLMFISAVTAGGFLLEQAAVAIEKSRTSTNQPRSEGAPAPQSINKNDDSIFYDNKLKTARYFIEVIVPENEALMSGAKQRNLDALDIVF